jgi:probable addiction module antidote protein
VASARPKKRDPADALKTPAARAAYLEAALKRGDSKAIAAALGEMARIKGMTHMARACGLGRQGMYRTLSRSGNPGLRTLLRVLQVLGIRLRAAPAK